MGENNLPDVVYLDGPNWHLDATRGEPYVKKSEYDRLAAEVARLREADMDAIRREGYESGVREAARLVDDFRRDPLHAGMGCDPMIDALMALAAMQKGG